MTARLSPTPSCLNAERLGSAKAANTLNHHQRCESDCARAACQGPQSPEPTFSPSGTISFTGGGNVAAPPLRPIEEPAAPGAVKITAHSTKTLFVSAPGTGKFTLTGSGLATLNKTAPKSGSYTLALTLTSSERTQLAKRRSVTLKVRVTFTPTSGKASSATTKVTIKKASPKECQSRRRKDDGHIATGARERIKVTPFPFENKRKG